jgi:hypothetical protein
MEIKNNLQEELVKIEKKMQSSQNQESMKESEQLLKVIYKCVICGSAAKQLPSYRFDEPEYANFCEKKECQKDYNLLVRAKYLPSYLLESGIPPRYWGIKPIKEAERFIGLRRGAYIHGSAGVGKTVMACLIGREEILKLHDVKFISSPRLIMELQNTFKKESIESAYEILETLSKREIIILDDIGAEKMTDFVRQAFYFLINEREQWERKTYITSNFSLSQLDQYIDGRVSSRIAGMCEIVELKGKDRRVINEHQRHS